MNDDDNIGADLIIKARNDIASTLINMSSLYSNAGKHAIALKYSI